MIDYISVLHHARLHAAYFTYCGIQYSFAGWWVLDWDGGSKDYDSVDEFLSDPLFDGKRFEEISDQLIDFDYDLQPYPY